MSAPLTPAAERQAAKVDLDVILGAMAQTNGNVRQAAKLLGVPRRTLDKRIQALGIRQALRVDYPMSGRQPTKGTTRVAVEHVVYVVARKTLCSCGASDAPCRAMRSVYAGAREGVVSPRVLEAKWEPGRRCHELWIGQRRVAVVALTPPKYTWSLDVGDPPVSGTSAKLEPAKRMVERRLVGRAF